MSQRYVFCEHAQLQQQIQLHAQQQQQLRHKLQQQQQQMQLMHQLSQVCIFHSTN